MISQVEGIACKSRLPPSDQQRYMLIMHRFCGQDEEHDPAEEFEEYLTCAVCGDHCKLLAGPRKLSPDHFGDLSSLHHPIAHRQCAREQDALKGDDGTCISLRPG